MFVINLLLNKILGAVFGTLPSGLPPSYPSISHLNYVKNLGSGLDPLPPFGTMSHISVFLRHPLAYSCIFHVILRKFEAQSKQDIKKPFAGTLLK